MSKSAYTVNLAGFDSLVYEKIRYPAGELQVRIRESEVQAVSSASEVRVIAQIRGAEDIVELALLADAIDGLNRDASRELILPYLPYGRADRRFVNGDCYGLKAFSGLIGMSVEGPIFDIVKTFDIHSKSIRNVINVEAEPVIRQAIRKFAGRKMEFIKDVTVLFPDEGAAKRYEIGDHAGDSFRGWVNIRKLYCTKVRDAATGKLSGFQVPDLAGHDEILIVDDICDGGGTFVGIAEEIEKQFNGRFPDLGLYVSHGIFSKGLGELNKYFEKIYTTNSFYDGRFGYDVHVFDCFRELLK